MNPDQFNKQAYSGVLNDRKGKFASLKRKGRASAVGGVLVNVWDANTWALKNGSEVSSHFTLGEIVHIRLTKDGLVITIVP